ncbi:MAG: YbaK/EbsC family protein [bacterium]
MPVVAKVLKQFEKNKVNYKLLSHKVTYTALDRAETQKIDMSDVVKTLVLKADKYYILACVPAIKNLDKNKVKKILNIYLKKQEEKAVKKVDFAKEAWMTKNIPGKVGSTPPFASLFLKKWASLKNKEIIPVIFDNALLKRKVIFLNSGDYKISIMLKPAGFLKVEEVLPGAISAPKKIKKQKKPKK